MKLFQRVYPVESVFIPKGLSPLRAGVTLGTVSKWQDFGVSSVERWFRVTYAVKEANRQKSVLTNRKD